MNSDSFKKIRIYGAGGHSQVIKAVLEQNGYNVVKMYDDRPQGVHKAVKEVSIGVRNDLSNFPHEGAPMIIAVGNNCLLYTSDAADD